MKTLMLTSSYPTSERPWCGVFVRNLATAISRMGVDVYVMVPSAKSTVWKDEGVKVVEYKPTLFFTPHLIEGYGGLLPSARQRFFPNFEIPSYFLSTLCRLLVTVSKKFDVIHAHWLVPSGFIAAMGKRITMSEIPTLITCWGADLHLRSTHVVRRIFRFAQDGCDVLIAVSDYLRKRASIYGLNPERIKVIPNGVDIGEFPQKRKFGHGGNIVVGTIARLVKEKRIDDLLHAVSYLKRENIRLLIVGDGEERRRLEELARRLGIHHITTFMGMLPHSEIPPILEKIDIFVNPSTQEGMSTATLEAMAVGLPVIAYDGFGNDEIIIDGQTGLLVPPRDVRGLSESLKSLIYSPGLMREFGERARAYVREKFSIASCAKKYIEEYELLTKK